MIRNDIIFVIIPLFFFLLLNLIFQKTWTLKSIIQKITKMLSFTLPLLLGYQFNRMIEGMRYADPRVVLTGEEGFTAVADTNIVTDIIGLVIGFG